MNGIALDPNPFLEGMTDRREKRKESEKKSQLKNSQDSAFYREPAGQ